MATVSLSATRREKTGKGVARKARRNGDIPGVVYRAGQDATPITFDPDVLELAFRKTGDRNTLVQLDVGGDQRTCLVRDSQRHPVSRALLHVDFYEVDKDTPVEVKVDVKAIGTAAGIKMGGRLRAAVRQLVVRCKPADIPSSIDINVSKMNIGDSVKASEVPAPPGCELVYSGDFNVIAILGKSAALVASEAAEAEAAESAEDAPSAEA